MRPDIHAAITTAEEHKQKRLRRERDYELLLNLYGAAEAYADLLRAAGNHEKADKVREAYSTVAREKVLERVVARPE